jgi:hypothetical protein
MVVPLPNWPSIENCVRQNRKLIKGNMRGKGVISIGPSTNRRKITLGYVRLKRCVSYFLLPPLASIASLCDPLSFVRIDFWSGHDPPTSTILSRVRASGYPTAVGCVPTPGEICRIWGRIRVQKRWKTQIVCRKSPFSCATSEQRCIGGNCDNQRKTHMGGKLIVISFG